MAGFLDSTYGVADARKERRLKLIVLWSLGILIAGGVLFSWFRNWPEERVMKQFIALLKLQKYQEAYKLFGENKYYPPEKFIEDWGPTGEFKDAGDAKIENEDVCGSGVLFTLAIPRKDPLGMWVESSTKVVGFAPNGWARCPGKHWQIWEYLKSRFS